MRTLFFTFLITSLLLMTSCGRNEYGNIRYIKYEFQDAAKAPEYRRDYTIHITNSEASAEITNGDSLLAVGHFNLEPGQMDSIVKTASVQSILSKHSEYLKENCGGCNTQTLTFMDSTQQVLEEIKWHGGLAPSSILLFKEEMMDQISNFNILLQSTFVDRDTVGGLN